MLIISNRVKLLIDGIFGDNLFNTIDEEVEKQIISSNGIFHGINCLLFTHCHEDHFNGLKVKQYMENNQKAKLIIPIDALVSKEFQVMYQLFKDRIFIIDHTLEIQIFKINKTKVYFYKTKHLDQQIIECENHYSIVIDDKVNRIFVAGDLEMNDKEVAKLFRNNSFDASFFNPTVLSQKNWLQNFRAVNSLKKFIYHIPSEKNDRFYYRKMAIYHFNLLKNKIVNCELLLDDLKKIRLTK